MTENIQPTELSELAQQFTHIINFMQRRANIRATLMDNAPDSRLLIKNSLSKLNNQNPQKNQEKNSNAVLAIQQLMQKIAEQLHEGHTILTLDTANASDYQLFEQLLTSEWVYLLSPNNNLDKNFNQNNKAIQIDKPIIMQVITEEQNINTYDVLENSNKAVVWLHRQWAAEYQLASQLLDIAKRSITQLTIESPQITNNSNSPFKTPNAEQQQAIANACTHALSIITGGPGTGKTFTVAQLVIALQHAHEAQKKHTPYLPPLSIALTAPTGKAAQRMEESLLQNLPEGKGGVSAAKTLHRLLGIGSNGIPRYHHGNPLPDDLVIVDEASMLGLELASQLVDAIKPTGRLILLGDANQLAAVDAGAVLADLCTVEALAPYRTELNQSRRFDDNSAIGKLAKAIKSPNNKGKITQIKKLLSKQNAAFEDYITFCELNQPSPQSPINYKALYQTLTEPFNPFFTMTMALLSKPIDLMATPSEENEVKKLFEAFDTYRILAAGHHGKLGDTAINQAISQLHKRKILNLPLSDSYFYHGQPIMMLTNDYQLGVFNGDIGICLLAQVQENQTAQLMAFFPDKIIDISRLNSESCTTAYALTIHKSQGSEFEHVAVCLDNRHKRLLSQELIYTAVTRSKQKLDIYSSQKLLENAVIQKGNRQTGLTLQFPQP